MLETSDSTITGKGQIDLGEETLALELLAHPKDASVLTASTPVRIEGTFKEPKVDLVSEELKAKSLAALALGVVLPVVGAILPFIEQGETEDKNCGRLIEDALASVERASPLAGRLSEAMDGSWRSSALCASHGTLSGEPHLAVVHYGAVFYTGATGEGRLRLVRPTRPGGKGRAA